MGKRNDLAHDSASRFCKFDGLPVKNSLPPLVDLAFRTGRQWHDGGYALRAEAEAVEMHPSSLTRRTCLYYHRDDVEKGRARR